MFCSLCDGPAYLLGILGRLAWFRCRHCGTDFNVNANTIDVDSNDE